MPRPASVNAAKAPADSDVARPRAALAQPAGRGLRVGSLPVDSAGGPSHPDPRPGSLGSFRVRRRTLLQTGERRSRWPGLCPSRTSAGCALRVSPPSQPSESALRVSRVCPPSQPGPSGPGASGPGYPDAVRRDHAVTPSAAGATGTQPGTVTRWPPRRRGCGGCQG